MNAEATLPSEGRSPPPFTLSLWKGVAELVEAFVPQAKGFDRLSPNGDKTGLRYLSPTGSLRALKFTCRPKTKACSTSRPVMCALEQLK